MPKDSIEAIHPITAYEKLCIDFAKDKITEAEFNTRSLKFKKRTRILSNKEVKCGTDTMYNKYMCRCDICRGAHRDARQLTLSRKEIGDYGNNLRIPHGTSSGYNYHKCRCTKCTEFWNGRNKRNRDRIS